MHPRESCPGSPANLGGRTRTLAHSVVAQTVFLYGRRPKMAKLNPNFPGHFRSPLTFRVCCPRFADRALPGLHHAIWSTPSPLHFLHAILYGWTQPPKNAFLRPPETLTTGTDCLPTLQAGPRYPRGRACPVGWPSAAPVPVDAGHPVWGVVPACGDVPIQSHSWSAIDPNTVQNLFSRIISIIALQE